MKPKRKRKLKRTMERVIVGRLVPLLIEVATRLENGASPGIIASELREAAAESEFFFTRRTK